MYNAEDRLVLCNSRYRDDIYPGIADIVVPGTPFESIVREAITRGLINGSDEEADTKIAHRLTQHRNPNGPILQKQSDGRWIQINERKMEDGA